MRSCDPEPLREAAAVSRGDQLIRLYRSHEDDLLTRSTTASPTASPPKLPACPFPSFLLLLLAVLRVSAEWE